MDCDVTMPWSSSELRKLGKCIRDDLVVPSSLPPYADVMLWFNELATSVQKRIEAADWSDILPGVDIEVTSRPKTIDTLRDKLRRDHATPLQNIADVAGVRFEAEMTLSQQTQVARRVARMFGHGDSSVHDLRATPHSGYRAVHVWLKLEGRVEVQVRTHLQGQWANMYEVVADYVGRNIRYDELPEDEDFAQVVARLRSYSTGQVTRLEERRDRIATSQQAIARATTTFETLSRKTRRELRYKKMIEQMRKDEVDLASLMAQMTTMETQARDTMINIRSVFDTARSQGLG